MCETFSTMFFLNASAKLAVRTLCGGVTFAAIGLASAQAPGTTQDLAKAQKEDSVAFAQAMQQLGQTSGNASAQQSKEIADAMKQVHHAIHEELDGPKMKAMIRDAQKEAREEMSKELRNLPTELKELKDLQGMDAKQKAAVSAAISQASKAIEESMKQVQNMNFESMNLDALKGLDKMQGDRKSFDMKAFHFNVPKFNFHMPAIHIHIPKMHFKKDGKDINVGEIRVDVPKINIDMKAVHVDIPAIHVKVPPVKEEKS
jgi:hypothetical protein